jgi:hypothetical protein
MSNQYINFSTSFNEHRFGPSFNNDFQINNSYTSFKSSDIDLISNSFHSVLSHSSIDTGLLPPGVRYISPGFVVFERPPSMHLIQYIDNSLDQISSEGEEYYDEENEQFIEEVELEPISTYYIPVPWQLYIASYSTTPGSQYFLTSVKMFFMNTPLIGDHVQLYSPYIPNFYANGYLCNPRIDSFDDINRYQKNISGVIESAYDWIWNTGFNADLYECISQTCVQKPNQFIKEQFIKKVNYYSSSIVNNFYEQISNLSLEEVTNMKWANPSYASHFNADKSMLQYYKFKPEEAFSLYLNKFQLPLDTSIDDDKVNFYSWLHENLDQAPKTYSHIINYMYKSQDTSLVNSMKPSLSLDDFDHFINAMFSSVNSSKLDSRSY